MEEIWNDFNLKKPPFLTLPAKHSQSVLELHAAIERYFRRYVIHEQEFNETAALLSRLMARRKNSFNKMKGFKEVCKLNAALCRLLRVDFKRELDSFRNTLPDVQYDEGTSVQLPTRDNFDFILIRLIAVYELYRRIGDCCESAAEYFICQIRMYFFFEFNTLLLAVLAKIRSMSIKLLKLAVDLYNTSLPCRLALPINLKSKFLKDCDFEFPAKLELIESNTVTSDTTCPKDKPFEDLVEQEKKLAPVRAQKLKRTDVGEQLNRPSKVTAKTFNIETLNTVEEIKRFIATESNSRSRDLKTSITTKVLSHEWAGATKLFQRKVQNGDFKKAVNIFRRFLSLKML